MPFKSTYSNLVVNQELISRKTSFLANRIPASDANGLLYDSGLTVADLYAGSTNKVTKGGDTSGTSLIIGTIDNYPISFISNGTSFFSYYGATSGFVGSIVQSGVGSVDVVKLRVLDTTYKDALTASANVLNIGSGWPTGSINIMSTVFNVNRIQCLTNMTISAGSTQSITIGTFNGSMFANLPQGTINLISATQNDLGAPSQINIAAGGISNGSNGQNGSNINYSTGNILGTGNSGHHIFTVGTASSGSRGNVLFFNNSSSFNSLQQGFVIGNATQIPLGNPTSGVYFYSNNGQLSKWESNGKNGVLAVISNETFTGNISFTGTIRLANQGSIPSAVLNSNILYSDNTGNLSFIRRNVANSADINRTFILPDSTQTYNFPTPATGSSSNLAGLGTVQSWTQTQTFLTAQATTINILDSTQKAALTVTTTGVLNVGAGFTEVNLPKLTNIKGTNNRMVEGASDGTILAFEEVVSWWIFNVIVQTALSNSSNWTSTVWNGTTSLASYNLTMGMMYVDSTYMYVMIDTTTPIRVARV